MSYILEHSAEAQRLELQKEIKAYSIKDELQGVDLTNKIILDAGCGGGDVCEYLIENSYSSKVFGCDQSDIRVAHSKKKNPQGTFFTSPLEKINSKDNSFDLTICRYVFEYLENPVQVLQELKRVTKINGEIVVIDIDGVFKNLHTVDTGFNQQLSKVVSLIDVDLSAGRKIPSYFENAGLIPEQIEMKSFLLRGSDLEIEKKNSEMRLITIKPILEKILGEEATIKFMKDYLYLMTKSSSTIFFNKFIVKGVNK